MFDGDKINLTATPDSLGMDDEDIIEAHYLLAAQLFRILATASAFGLNCIVTSKPVMELIGDGVYASKKQAQKLLDHGASFADGLNFMCGQNTASLRSQIFAYHDFWATVGILACGRNQKVLRTHDMTPRKKKQVASKL
ncbi:hypothetical protein OIU84_019130 [Salix udensis]|uniref:Uncharacterized protein n=1 Tax=Salix udensis TaxID=889485 RepID=A0AAD6PKL7_9ROSI|nr:hypothetical protein OIU84_019130 [Salix udensis]